MQNLPAHAHEIERLRESPHGWLEIPRPHSGLGDIVLRQTSTPTHVCRSDMELRTMLRKEYYHLDMSSKTCQVEIGFTLKVPSCCLLSST